jgi:hypothetical protein
MFFIFKRIWLALTYGPELDVVAKKIREEKEKRQKELERHHLKLCFKHQQEKRYSHFSEHNCDYCKLLKKYDALGRVYSKTLLSQKRNPK